MPISQTLTSDGQFTFDKQLMDHIGVKAGDRILISKLPDGSLRIEAEAGQIDLMSLAGSLKSANREDVRLNDEELAQAIRDGYTQRARQGLE